MGKRSPHGFILPKVAHGLGATKELGLDKYCEAFSSVGYTCLAFDYRHHGGSTGKPRGLINVSKQLEDFHSAIAYIRSLSEVDAERVGIFGSSFGGGNVIQVASQDSRLKATISQCPFTSGFHSSLTTGVMATPFIVARALRDLMWGSDDEPITISLIGEPGSSECGTGG
jgi:cephalosporin-C deacetylase-like acetyl esterase